MKVIHKDLFPTRIWSVQCEPLLVHHPQWIAHIETLRLTSPQAAGRSNRGGWNSHAGLFGDEVFEPIQQTVVKLVEAAMNQNGKKGTWRLTIGAWANVHGPGGYNTLHMHPGHIFSGVYYLQVPDNAGALVLRDPKVAAIMAGFAGDQPFSRHFETIMPKAGQLILFPSWLEHRVEENNSNENRISIAFNIKIQGVEPADQ